MNGLYGISAPYLCDHHRKKEKINFLFLEIVIFANKGGFIMANAMNITDLYMSVLSSLSDDNKLDLIAKLTESMRHKKDKKAKVATDVFACFHEDWGGNNTPEKISQELRESRTFRRTLDTW